MGLIHSIFKYLFIFYLASSYKSLPGAYFVRFYISVVNFLFLPYLTGKNTKNLEKLKKHELSVFAHSELTTYCSPFECDLYLHKNNATYFNELDINRVHWFVALFQKLMLNSKRWPYVPVANVFTNFLKEIRPFEKYSVCSGILCWDEKWIYVLSRFTKNNGKTLCSISLTKYVLKDVRKTIPPIEALKFCGLYNEKAAKINAKNYDMLIKESGFHNTKLLEEFEFIDIVL